MAKKKDITRIEDLGEFHHEDDHEVDELLEQNSPPPISKLPEDPQDEYEGEDEFEDDSTEFNMTESSELSEDSFGASHDEDQEDLQDDFQSQYQEDFQGDSQEKLQENFQEDLQEIASEGSQEDFHDDFHDDFQEDFQADPQEDFQENFQEDIPDNQTDELNNISQDSFRDDNTGETNPIANDNANDNLDNRSVHKQERPQMQPQAVETIATVQATPAPVNKSYDLKELSYGTLGQGHGPPFSILIKLKDKNYIQHILELLDKSGITNDENHDEYQTRLENGELLISQLSEYSAIYLAHRLKQFKAELQVGLSHLIHQSSSYNEEENAGIAGVTQLNANKQVFTNYLSDIVISTSESPIEFDHENLGLIQASRLLSEYQMQKVPALQNQDNLEKSNEYLEYKEIFEELIAEIKHQAKLKGANLVANANFQVTPILSEADESGDQKYHLFFQGSLIKL